MFIIFKSRQQPSVSISTRGNVLSNHNPFEHQSSNVSFAMKRIYEYLIKHEKLKGCKEKIAVRNLRRANLPTEDLAKGEGRQNVVLRQALRELRERGVVTRDTGGWKISDEFELTSG